MAQFIANFSIEAATLEEAEAAIGTWVVSAGTTLTSLTGMVASSLAPIDVAEGGSVADGVRTPSQPMDPTTSQPMEPTE
jgi:hypothetical protein